MTEKDKDPAAPHGDPAADLIHDLANDAPPKGLDTVKAASDAMAVEGEKDPAAARRERIERRAYELWEEAGGHHGSHEDFWLKAEAEAERGEP